MESNKSKAACLDGLQELFAEDLLRRVEWKVEAGDARIGRGQMLVVRRANHDGGHRREALSARGQSRRRRPEVELKGQGERLSIKLASFSRV